MTHEQTTEAMNAAHEDDSKPISAEWLNSLPGAINVGDRQWLCSVSPDASLRIFLGRTSFVQVKFPNVSEAIHREIKTREEVFAWHVVLGRPLKETSK